MKRRTSLWVGGAFAVAVFLVAGPGGQAGEGSIAPGIGLTRVGTVGDVPGPENRIVVSIDAGGTLRAGSGEVDLAGLTRALAAATRVIPREADGASHADLVLALDGSVPWRAVQWVMTVAAQPLVRIYRVHFAVRPEEGDEEGALATFLPRDRGVVPTKQFVRDDVTARARVALGDVGTDPAALFAALRAAPAKALRLEVDADALAPTAFVLRVVDTGLRAGVQRVQFLGTAPPRDAEAWGRLFADAVKSMRRPTVTLDGVVLAGPAEPMPPVARVRGGPAGDLGVPGSENPVLPRPRASHEPFGEPPLPPVQPGTPELPEEPAEESPTIGIGGGAGLPQSHFRTVQADEAVSQALRWLAAHQSPDGSWSAAGFAGWCDGKPADAGPRPDGVGKPMYDPGVTGLALCAFLGAGYTNRGVHPYARVVSKGLRWLKAVQDPEGCFGPRTTQHYIYNHALASFAMVEAYGMTRSPIFKGSAQKALDFIALSRNPYFAWRYGVKPGDNDTSITGWMVSVLASARLVNVPVPKPAHLVPDLGGDSPPPEPPLLRVDPEAFEGAKHWIDKMTDSTTGRVGYIQPGTGPARPQESVDKFPSGDSEAMTAAACFARVLMGEKTESSPALQKGVTLLLGLPPLWDPASGRIDMYYWFYATKALWHVGGDAWTAWSGVLRSEVLPHQRKDGENCTFKGSWDPIDPWGPDGGRVYSTALLAMTLETLSFEPTEK